MERLLISLGMKLHRPTDCKIILSFFCKRKGHSALPFSRFVMETAKKSGG